MSTVCNECGWQSMMLMEVEAKELAMVHIIKRHPDIYASVTHKEVPILTEEQQYELKVFTDPFCPGRL